MKGVVRVQCLRIQKLFYAKEARNLKLEVLNSLVETKEMKIGIATITPFS